MPPYDDLSTAFRYCSAEQKQIIERELNRRNIQQEKEANEIEKTCRQTQMVRKYMRGHILPCTKYDTGFRRSPDDIRSHFDMKRWGCDHEEKSMTSDKLNKLSSF